MGMVLDWGWLSSEWMDETDHGYCVGRVGWVRGLDLK